MAEITVCDRCGNKIESYSLSRFVRVKRYWDVFNTKYQICIRCSDELDLFLEGRKVIE